MLLGKKTSVRNSPWRKSSVFSLASHPTEPATDNLSRSKFCDYLGAQPSKQRISNNPFGESMQTYYGKSTLVLGCRGPGMRASMPNLSQAIRRMSRHVRAKICPLRMDPELEEAKATVVSPAKPASSQGSNSASKNPRSDSHGRVRHTLCMVNYRKQLGRKNPRRKEKTEAEVQERIDTEPLLAFDARGAWKPLRINSHVLEDYKKVLKMSVRRVKALFPKK